MRMHPQAVRGTSTARRAARAASLGVLVLALALLALPVVLATILIARILAGGAGRDDDLLP